MRSHSSEFWKGCERYHELARRVERDIEVVHPKVLTGRSGCGYCPFACSYCASTVTYYEYRGERI